MRIVIVIGCLVAAFVASWFTAKPLNKTIARQARDLSRAECKIDSLESVLVHHGIPVHFEKGEKLMIGDSDGPWIETRKRVTNWVKKERHFTGKRHCVYYRPLEEGELEALIEQYKGNIPDSALPIAYCESTFVWLYPDSLKIKPMKRK